MNYLLAMLVGVVVTLMITVNGLLSSAVGAIEGLILFQIVGLICAIIYFKFKGDKISNYKGIKAYLYFGGALGALMVASNNICFQELGVSLTVALILIGQLAGSTLIDHFGWLGMEKTPFNIEKLGPFALMAVGIFLMV